LGTGEDFILEGEEEGKKKGREPSFFITIKGEIARIRSQRKGFSAAGKPGSEEGEKKNRKISDRLLRGKKEKREIRTASRWELSQQHPEGAVRILPARRGRESKEIRSREKEGHAE